MTIGYKNVHIRTKQMHKLFQIINEYNLNQLEVAIFKSLFQFFSPLLGSSYYKVLTMSDGKYSLTIRKDTDDMYDIKYTINPNGNCSRNCE